jgi:hypothetical protein
MIICLLAPSISHREGVAGAKPQLRDEPVGLHHQRPTRLGLRSVLLSHETT